MNYFGSRHECYESGGKEKAVRLRTVRAKREQKEESE